MRNKILLVVVLLLGIVTGVVVRCKKKTDHSFFSQEETIKVKTKEEEIQELNLETYLIGVLAAEMHASFEEEALKAQAVASRTYALYKIKHSTEDYDIVSDVTNQSFINEEEMKEKWLDNYDYYYNRIKNAIDNTKEEILTYHGEIIEAFYFAMSNGATEDVQSVFGETLPYIKSVSSSWEDESLHNFLVNKTISKSEFCKLLQLNTCNTIQIDAINRSATHRVRTISINNKVFKGTEIRTLLNLRSTDFTIEEQNDYFIISTKGYGHGVGMSQYGANGMAKAGYNYEEILKYYYNDVELNKMV